MRDGGLLRHFWAGQTCLVTRDPIFQKNKSLRRLGFWLEEKSKILFHILQAGEINANSTIRRDCPDFKRVFQKMLKFATLYIFEFVRHFGQGGNRYDKNITAIRNAIEAEGKGSLLSEVKDKVFGKSQTVSFQKWEAAIRAECAWLFDVRSCRAKVLKQCKLM